MNFLVGDRKIQLLCFFYAFLSDNVCAARTHTHTRSHTQKVQYQMATSVEHEIMSMSGVIELPLGVLIVHGSHARRKVGNSSAEVPLLY